MRCPACGEENRTGARFCGQCATPLGTFFTCTGCGAKNSVGQKFCDACGLALTEAPAGRARDLRAYTPAHLAEKILRLRSALEGERKQVTVLFADVQGSMDLAETVDAEEWHLIMDRFFAILSDGVHRFEGTINQFTGDGIMALFGAPIAHEDHAHRACHAALALTPELARYAHELRRTRGLSFSVRIGLNSGEVVVGKIGDDLRMDYTAQGRTVGLAARMEQIAAPDRIYLTEHTARLVREYFRLADLGEFDIKGVRKPVRIYELEGVGPIRTRLEASRARGFSLFVGRDEESRTLEAALARALRGEGEIVAVVAEAGVGKSRLTYEFVERCRGHGIAVFEARAVAHGKTVPLLGVLELLRSYFGIGDRDGDAEVRRKVAGTLVLLDESLRESLPLMFEFLGVADPDRPAPRVDPEARRRQLLALMRRVLTARSRREPAVIVFEDLHWIDEASETFLRDLADAIPGTRSLLVVNFRPEYSAPWLVGEHRRLLPLAPLGPEATVALLGDLLGDDDALATLSDRIRARAGGNPFFLEEIVLSLRENGVLAGSRGSYHLSRDPADLAIPSTVQAVLAARIDRLAEREKEVLQTAAVVGREFALPVLASVAALDAMALESVLRRLVAADFVYEHALFPEAVYAFKHPLTHEVAYFSQLSERRRRIHAAVARALADLTPEKSDSLAVLVAHHWEHAGERLEAARWTRRAAEWAEMRNLGEALRHWETVRVLVDGLPESPETMKLGLISRTGMISLGIWYGDPEGRTAALFAEGKTLAGRLGDLRSLALLEAAYSGALTSTGEVEAAVDHALEGARLAAAVGDESVKLALRVPLVYAFEVAGRIEEALKIAEEALVDPPRDRKLGASVLGFSPFAFLALCRAEFLTYVGRLDEGREQLVRALALAQELAEPEILALCHGFFCHFARCVGEAEIARQHAPQAVKIAESTGSALSRTVAYRGLGSAHLMARQWAEAAAAFEKALTIASEARTVLWVSAYILADLAEARLGNGQVELARETASRALAEGMRMRTKGTECHARLALARILLAADGLRAATEVGALLDEALRGAHGSGQRTYVPHIHLAAAELARLSDDAIRWQEELREAERTFLAIGAVPYAREVARKLASLEAPLVAEGSA
jgi:class 3 adenylate cyclase/tetratricopeptide (TPR) repeat protein